MHLTLCPDTSYFHREAGQTMFTTLRLSQVPIPLTMHKSPRLLGLQTLGPFSPQLPVAAYVTGGLVTGLSAPGWPQPSSIHFHVAVKGKPKHTFTWPTYWDHLLETQKDSRPHPKELAPSLPLPLLTHRTHPLSETWFSPLENENSALSTSQLIGRVQERISGLDFGILVKLYLNTLLILPEIHSFIQLPVHSFNKHFLST